MHFLAHFPNDILFCFVFTYESQTMLTALLHTSFLHLIFFMTWPFPCKSPHSFLSNDVWALQPNKAPVDGGVTGGEWIDGLRQCTSVPSLLYLGAFDLLGSCDIWRGASN